MGDIQSVFTLPVSDPILLFTVVMLLILVIPFISRFFRIPDIAGYILAGLLLGPNAFNLLTRDNSIVLLGTVGLIYIMFLAGMELNLRDLSRNRSHSVWFGLSTFVIPLIAGFILCYLILDLSLTASLLISIMFSTHTLIAYPVARRLGITTDRSVMAAVGGTIITDTLVLFILAIITGTLDEGEHLWKIFTLLFSFAVYLTAIFLIYPALAAWFFRYVKKERPVQYAFLLVMIFISASVAEMLDIEPIIGAFIAGLALNRVMAKNPTLLARVEFLGNALFIPVFLINIGMLINPKLFVQGKEVWWIAFLLFVIAMGSKWLAAFITQKLNRFSRIQRNVMFGLSSSHAAATIAIILIGFDRGLINSTVFNAVILIILFSCLAASIVTERAGRQLAVVINKEREISGKANEKILLPVANPSTMPNLFEFALELRGTNIGEPIYALSVHDDSAQVKENIKQLQQNLDQLLQNFNTYHENIQLISRIDLNVANGIVRASKELQVTDIIIGWGEKSRTGEILFGNIFEQLLEHSWLNLYVCHFRGQLHNFRKIIVIIPPNYEYESGFNNVMQKLMNIPFPANSRWEIHLTESARDFLNRHFPDLPSYPVDFSEYHNIADIPHNVVKGEAHELKILFYPRKHQIAYHSSISGYFRKTMRLYKDESFILVSCGYDEDVFEANPHVDFNLMDS